MRWLFLPLCLFLRLQSSVSSRIPLPAHVPCLLAARRMKRCDWPRSSPLRKNRSSDPRGQAPLARERGWWSAGGQSTESASVIIPVLYVRTSRLEKLRNFSSSHSFQLSSLTHFPLRPTNTHIFTEKLVLVCGDDRSSAKTPRKRASAPVSTEQICRVETRTGFISLGSRDLLKPTGRNVSKSYLRSLRHFHLSEQLVSFTQ